MASRADNLNAALDNIAAQLADMTANPKPSYSAGGRSISWGEHFNNLVTQQEKLYAALQMADGPFEVRSEGVSW
jgi:hypothetical protein